MGERIEDQANSSGLAAEKLVGCNWQGYDEQNRTFHAHLRSCLWQCLSRKLRFAVGQIRGSANIRQPQVIYQDWGSYLASAVFRKMWGRTRRDQ